jgi:hypothetical protein
MLMKSRGGPTLWVMNSRGEPPHFERGSASRDNFYGSYGTNLYNLVTKSVLSCCLVTVNGLSTWLLRP